MFYGNSYGYGIIYVNTWEYVGRCVCQIKASDQIRENAKEFIATIIKLKPSSAKGTYIKSIYLSSTMSKGIKIDPKTVEEN